MKPLWVFLFLACSLLPACRERDAHATCERVWGRGTLRVGLSANPAERSYVELALLERVAARLGATVEPFPAPVPDLTRALAAGVIDVVIVSGEASSPTEGLTRLDVTFGDRKVGLLIREGEDGLLGLCRREADRLGR